MLLSVNVSAFKSRLPFVRDNVPLVLVVCESVTTLAGAVPLLAIVKIPDKAVGKPLPVTWLAVPL